MGQLTEQYIRVRARPFIVEVDQQTNNVEQKMSVVYFFIWIIVEEYFFFRETNSIIEKGCVVKILNFYLLLY